MFTCINKLGALIWLFQTYQINKTTLHQQMQMCSCDYLGKHKQPLHFAIPQHHNIDVDLDELRKKRKTLEEKVNIGDIKGLEEALVFNGLCIDPLYGCCGLYGQTYYKPLAMAVKKGRLDIVKLLVENGAHVLLSEELRGVRCFLYNFV